MSQFAIFAGVARYEFRMQIRRRSLWIVYAIFALLIAAIVFGNDSSIIYKAIVHPETVPLNEAIVYWTTAVNYLFPIVVGIMVADRLPRDRRTRVQELLIATPGSLSVRLFGKYVGSTLAALTPLLLMYTAGIGYVLFQTHNLLAIPLALGAFASVILPGILFVSAFSLACPSFLWVPLYQFSLSAIGSGATCYRRDEAFRRSATRFCCPSAATPKSPSSVLPVRRYNRQLFYKESRA